MKKIDNEFVPLMKFENSWLPWITLRHLLPASSVRMLCQTMVREMSGGRLSLEDLVDEQLSGGDTFMETWVIRPKATSSELAGHLRQYVQKIVWKNDEDVWFGQKSLKEEASLPLEILQFAFNLGGCDLLNIVKAPPDDNYVQTDLKSLYDSIVTGASYLEASSTPEITNVLQEIDSTLNNASLELRIATIKHLGDLFCDRDKWGIAEIFYKHAISILNDFVTPEKSNEFFAMLRGTIEQSLASSGTILYGYESGKKILEKLKDNSQVQQTMVLSNTSLDEYVARIRSSNTISIEDKRSAALIAPLLAESHSIEHAMTSWRAKKYPKAEEWFWSTLRRQTALGLNTASKATKGSFASCLIDDLIADKSYDPEKFKLAIGLLIESESAEVAKEIQWPEHLLDTYLNQELCDFVIQHTDSHAGSQKHRQSVTIVLFTEWAQDIGATSASLATLMLHYLISAGSDLQSSFIRNGADFQTCFGAVLKICERRPEFRVGIRTELAEILARRIGSIGYWTGEDIALRLATECASVFTPEGLRDVVTTVVNQLKDIPPSDGNWVIVKPAIRLLSEEAVGTLAESNEELGHDIVREVLKFGSDESGGTYAADIIFALNRYNPSFLRVAGIEEQYKQVIRQALDKAAKINASNSINFIMALLVAPQASGKNAIAGVLKILGDILDLGIGGKSPLIFSSAYAPIRYLVAYRTDICRESEYCLDEFNETLFEFCNKMEIIWHTAIEHPSIFAPFSLLHEPPADRAIVHNWVVTSLEIAEAFDRVPKMQAVLEKARIQKQLSDGISLGFASRRAGGAEVGVDVDFMSTESREAFYAAIGRRLSALRGNVDRSFIKALFENTLRHGPRQVDAAVFASVTPSDIDGLSNLCQELEDYKARIGDKRELSLTLIPLVDHWQSAARA